MSEEPFEKTFPVSAPARLKLDNIRGSVEILPGADDAISVTAVKRPGSGDLARTEIEMLQEQDGTVRVSTRFPDGGWTWLFGSHPCCVDYIVRTPRQCSLDLNGVSNSLEVGDINGEFHVTSVSGEVALRDLEGDLRLHTVSGRAHGERLIGRLDLDSVSGDLDFSACSLPAVAAKTVSGNLSLQTSLGDGPYAFNTVSGAVRLALPGEARCTVELNSLSGQIVTAFPVSSYAQAGGIHTVALQGGGVPLTMHSVSGSLSLDREGGDPVTAGVGLSAEERRALLERLERGEVTVEEALAQLRG